jgi:hypothetical protein
LERRGTDRQGHWMSDVPRRASQAPLTPQEQFQQITEEIEHLVWRILVRPGLPADLIRVWQLTATVELLPQVFLEIVHRPQADMPDRYLRLWYVTVDDDGQQREIPLLTFFTETFPDPSYTRDRLGMNLNLQWWQVLHSRLLEIAATLDATEDGRALEPPSGMLGAVPNGAPFPVGTLSARLTIASSPQGAPDGDPAMARPTRFSSRRETFPPLLSPETTSAGESWPRSTDRHQLGEQQRQVRLYFEECLRLREQAYHERNEMERQLTDLYFGVHPVMQLAAKHISASEIHATITTWAELGCPPPGDTDLLPLALTTAGGGPPPMDLEAQLARARDVATQLATNRVVVQERTRALQRACELAGGHEPRTDRDAQGAPRTSCTRCGAQLSSQVPDRHEGWLTS